MNITITKIENGWVVSISSPKGQVAHFTQDFDKALEYLVTAKKELEGPNIVNLRTK